MITREELNTAKIDLESRLYGKLSVAQQTYEQKKDELRKIKEEEEQAIHAEYDAEIAKYAEVIKFYQEEDARAKEAEAQAKEDAKSPLVKQIEAEIAELNNTELPGYYLPEDHPLRVAHEDAISLQLQEVNRLKAELIGKTMDLPNGVAQVSGIDAYNLRFRQPLKTGGWSIKEFSIRIPKMEVFEKYHALTEEINTAYEKRSVVESEHSRKHYAKQKELKEKSIAKQTQLIMAYAGVTQPGDKFLAREGASSWDEKKTEFSFVSAQPNKIIAKRLKKDGTPGTRVVELSIWAVN